MNTFIRRYSIEVFGKSFSEINEKEVSSIHWKTVTDVNKKLRFREKINDKELILLLNMFGVTVKAYFDRLDELLMGKLLTMYKFEKAYISDELLGTYIEIREENNVR